MATVAAGPIIEKNAQDARQTSASEDARWAPVLGLWCEITVELPVPDFQVSKFLSLRCGSVIGTRAGMGRDVPLRVNGTLIGWGELEAAGKKLAVRLTELA